MNESRQPLVIIPLDSGDSTLISKWINDGYLPHMKRIANQGFFSTIREPELVNEMGTWVSLLSGIPKITHGYHSLRQLIPGTYTIRTVTPRAAVNTLPFWCYTNAADLNCLVVDPPEFNVYPGIKGLQIANWGTHNRCGRSPED